MLNDDRAATDGGAIRITRLRLMLQERIMPNQQKPAQKTPGQQQDQKQGQGQQQKDQKPNQPGQNK